MTKYMKEHEKYILDAIKKEDCLNNLLEYHNQQISWLQHERLVHLLVMLFTVLLFLFSITSLFLLTNMYTTVLSLCLGVLTIAYIIHYYFLENTVQRWYKISNTITNHLHGTGANIHIVS